MVKRFSQDYFNLLLAMTMKEFIIRYKGAVIGLLWIFINPVLQMLIVGTIFSFFIKMENYYVFLLIGLLSWQFFSTSLSKATICYVSERFLLQKAIFPREIIVLSIVLSNFLNLNISVLLLTFAILIINPATAPNVFILLIALFWLLMFTVGCCLLCAVLYVRFRDVNMLVQSLLTLWIYATPVLYSLRLVPDQLLNFFYLNPLSGVFEVFHYAFHGDVLLNNQLIIVNLLIGGIVFILGVLLFKKESRNIVDFL